MDSRLINYVEEVKVEEGMVNTYDIEACSNTFLDILEVKGWVNSIKEKKFPFIVGRIVLNDRTTNEKAQVYFIATKYQLH